MDVVKWVVVAVVVLALAWLVFRYGPLGVTRRSVLSATHEGEEVLDPREEQLRYRMPAGQDPVVLLTALRQDGYDAVTVMEGGHHVVVVSCPAGPDRDRGHVRSVIRSAAQTSPEGHEFDPGEVVFEDEVGDAPVGRQEGPRA
jgi:hypothetical protein